MTIELTGDDFIQQHYDITNDYFEIMIEVEDLGLCVPIIIRDMFWSDEDDL